MTENNVGVHLGFSTNAAAVAGQVDALTASVSGGEAGAERAATRFRVLDKALRANAASSKELGYGILGTRKALAGLDDAINRVAADRVKTARSMMTANQQMIMAEKGITPMMLKQHEALRVRRKIIDDTATSIVNLGKNTQWAGRQLVVGFTVPLTIAAGAATMAFANLEKQMLRFGRVYGDINTGNKELADMTKQVRAAALEWTKYGVAVSDTAEIAASAAGAGMTGSKLLSQINAATKLAVLGEVEKQAAFKATLALQSTFKQSNQELGASINYLNMLENQTIVTLQDMTAAIPKAATVVAGLGGSIKDLGTFMAAMEEGGVKANEAANALKSGLGSLLNPSKAAQDALAGVNVSLDTLWKESESNGEGVIHVVEELGSALDKLGSVQRQRIIEELFGKHQFARMNALLTNINSGVQAQQAKKVGGTSQIEAALVAQKELNKVGASTLTKFQASIKRIQNAIAPIGESIMQLLTKVVNFGAKMAESFNNLPDVMKKFALGAVAAIGIVAPTLLMLLGQAQNLFGNFLKLRGAVMGFGKNLKWVSSESMILSDSIMQVTGNVTAQNTQLARNAALWAKITGTAAGIKAKVLPRKFATGGNVPGSGNGDTIPAMLTPGEFVVRKDQAKKFGGILNAINNGSLRLFAKGGKADKGYTSNLAPGETKLSQAERMAQFQPYMAPDVTAGRAARRWKLSASARADLEQQLMDDIARGVQAGHIVKDVDPASGEKVYRNANSAAIPFIENQYTEKLAGGKNLMAMERAMKEMNDEAGTTVELMQKRQAVLQKTIKGEMLVDKAEREMYADIVMRAEGLSGPGPVLQPGAKKNARALAASMLVTPNTFTGEPVSAAVADRERARIAKSQAASADQDEKINKRSGNRAGAVGILLMTFGGQLSGLTDKLGKFSDVVTMAITAISSMVMMGFNPLAGVGGKLGATGIGSKIAGSGLLAKAKNLKWARGGVGGLVGGIAGTMIGSKIKDNNSGMRDAAGSAVQWGATGAGLGMMFGPMGAGIGAAVGALAGFVIQANAGRKALAKLNDNLRNGGKAWADIAAELQDKFNLGTLPALGSRLSGVNSMTKDQQALYQTMTEAMKDSEGPWAARINTLIEAQKKGQLRPGQIDSEIRGIAAELLGRGVDPESIKVITAAFVNQLPDAVRQGFDASKIAEAFEPTLASLTEALQPLTDFGNIATLKATAASSYASVMAPSGYGSTTGPAVTGGSYANGYVAPPTQTATNEAIKQRLDDISRVASGLTGLAKASQNIIANTPDIAKNKSVIEEAKAAYASVKEYAAKSYEAVKGNDAEKNQYLGTIGAEIHQLITDDKAQGLTADEWSKMLQDAGANSVELSAAAAALLNAGISIKGMSEAGVRALSTAANAYATASAANSEAKARMDAIAKDQQALDSANAWKSSEKKKNAWEIPWSAKDVALTKVEAELDVVRINMESAALGEFVGKFNKAFGASIDSFADAQYQIDSIGRSISEIQRTKIQPIQDKIETLNHANELDQRKIEGLQKRQSKWDENHQKKIEKVQKENDARAKKVEDENKARIDAINAAYDKQAQVLEAIAAQNDYINNQSKTRIDLAGALSQGDLQGAAKAMADSAANQSQYAGTFAQGTLDSERQRALARAEAQNAAATARVDKGNTARLDKVEGEKNPYTTKIEAIQATIDERTASIRKNEDAIYAINKKQIEPLTRRQAAMSAMLDTEKAELANRQANAKGIDAENLARERSLLNAQKTNHEAKTALTLEQKINAEYRSKIKDIKKRYETELKGAGDLKSAMDVAYEKAAADAASTQKAMDAAALSISSVKSGSKDAIEIWNGKPEAGSDLEVLQQVVELLKDDNKSAEPKPTGKSTPGQTSPFGRWVGDSTGGGWTDTLKKAVGGKIPVVPGSGGRDSVKALLTPGEFVMRKSAVKRLGVNTLDRLNRGAKFAKGGIVPERLATMVRGTKKFNDLNVPVDEGVDTSQAGMPARLIGDHAAVTSSSNINSGLYYSEGKRHMEPWTSQFKDSGVADISGDLMPVHAYAQGVVTYAGKSASFGPGRVEIRHANGGYTRYGHMKPSSIGVKVGDTVSAGQSLGTTDTYSSGTSHGGWTNKYGHLHFAWRGMPDIPQPKNGGPVPWYAGGLVQFAKGGLAKLKGKGNAGLGAISGTNSAAASKGLHAGSRFSLPQFLGNFGPVTPVMTDAATGDSSLTGISGGFSGGDSFKDERNQSITRGKWVTLGKIPKLKKGYPYHLEGQVNLDVGHATGGRPKQIALRWNRLGWGEQSKGGGNDPVMAQDFLVTPQGDQFRQSFFHDLQTGGGPLAMQIRVPGKGKLNANRIIWKYFLGGGDGKSGQGSSTSVDSTTGGQSSGGKWGSGTRAKFAAKLHSLGLSPSGAAAAIGNFIDESSLRTTAKGDGGHSHGLAQWQGSRWTHALGFAKENGLNIWDWVTQLKYFLHELKGYSSLNAALRKGGDVSGLSRRILQEYERPKDKATGGTNDRERAAYARSILKSYKFSKGGVVPGTGNRDSVHSMLTPGEVVMNRDAVNAVGEKNLSALNRISSAKFQSPRSVGSLKSVGQNGIVYNSNQYDLTFEISDATDPHQVANLVMQRIERAGRGTRR